MAIAFRLNDGTHLAPVPPAATFGFKGATSTVTVKETPHVHVGSAGMVSLDPGTVEFTVVAPPLRETLKVLNGFHRVVSEPDLPAFVKTEQELSALDAEWENVRSLYRRDEDTAVVETPQEAVVKLSEYRVLDADVTHMYDNEVWAAQWIPDAEHAGLRRPFSAVVPGRLTGVPDAVLAALRERSGTRSSLYGGVSWELSRPSLSRPADSLTVTATFHVAYSDERTKTVKADPHNTRRNAKRVQVADTKTVTYTRSIPTSLPAADLQSAVDALRELVEDIIAGKDADPVTVCAACSGDGVVLADHLREKVYRT